MTIFGWGTFKTLFLFPWNKSIGLGSHVFTTYVISWGNGLRVSIHEWDYIYICWINLWKIECLALGAHSITLIKTGTQAILIQDRMKIY